MYLTKLYKQFNSPSLHRDSDNSPYYKLRFFYNGGSMKNLFKLSARKQKKLFKCLSIFASLSLVFQSFLPFVPAVVSLASPNVAMAEEVVEGEVSEDSSEGADESKTEETSENSEAESTERRSTDPCPRQAMPHRSFLAAPSSANQPFVSQPYVESSSFCP